MDLISSHEQINDALAKLRREAFAAYETAGQPAPEKLDAFLCLRCAWGTTHPGQGASFVARCCPKCGYPRGQGWQIWIKHITGQLRGAR